MRPDTAEIKPHLRPSRGLGFTLMELLVTVAICAILMGILVPVLASAKRAAKATVEISQLRQIGQAQAIYMQDEQYVGSLQTLVDTGLLPSAMCASPNDVTPKGIANEMVSEFATHSTQYANLALPYPSTYVGFREYQYPQSWYDEYVNVNPNPGWLVSFTETSRLNPLVWETTLLGKYRRLLFDGAVVLRNHSTVDSGAGAAQHPLQLFSDGSDEWKKKLISVSP